MSMSISKRPTQVLVTNTSGGNTGTSITTIIDGDLLVLNRALSNLTGTPTPTSGAENDAIYLALGVGAGKAKLSNIINANLVKSWRKEVYSAPVEQVTDIGYNGTANALAMDTSKEYRLRIVFNDEDRVTPHRQTGRDYYSNTLGATDQYSRASDLAKKVNKDNNRAFRGKVIAEVTGDGAITELTMDPTLTKDSVTVAATAHSLTVGTLVVFRSVVYKVAKVVDANTFELDRPYSGATETIDVSATVDLAGTIAAGNYGIKLKGQKVTTRSVDFYQKVSFDAALAPVNGVPGEEETVTYTTPVNIGRGFWEQVRDMEKVAASFDGFTNPRQFPSDEFTPRAVSTGTYTQYVIEYDLEHEEGLPEGNVVKTTNALVLAFDISVATTKADAVEGILDSWMAGAGLPNV